MQVRVYDFRWRENEGVFSCEFEAQAGGKFGRKKIWLGDTLSLDIRSDVACAGSVENDIWKPCPNNVVGKAKCEYCRAREGSFVYTTFDGFDQSNLNAEDLQKISGEHWVYFALFADGIVKVGVSKNPRKNLRQVEQGSFATLFIAKTPDGTSARQIETLIRKTGLADKIKASQKKEFLCPEVSNPEESLRSLLVEKTSALQEYPHLKEFLLPDPQFFAWQETYGLKGFSENLHSLSLDTGEWVSGEIVALKGPFIVLKTPDEYVSICAKDLRGREIEFEPKPAGLQLNAALQGALF